MRAALVVVLVSPAPLASALQVSIPLRLGGAYFQHVAQKRVFTDPEGTYVAWNDGTGCNHLVLSEPALTVDESGIRVAMRGEGRAGSPVGDMCVPLLPWEGEIEVLMRPSVAAAGTGVDLEIVDSSVRNARGEADFSGTVWDWTKRYVHPRMASLRIDLERHLTEVRAAARQLFPSGSMTAVDDMLESLAVAGASVGPEGMSLTLTINVDDAEAALQGDEPALSQAELAQVEEGLNGWDALFTLAARRAASYASDAAMRDRLLEALLDMRHEIVRILENANPGPEDPVRVLFLDSWSVLSPLLREVSASVPDESALDFIAFIGAMDALQAIDAVGPGFGVEISTNGLRRLARLLAPRAPGDPLEFDERVDPELRRLFDFGRPIALPQQTPPSGGWLMRSAWAHDSQRRGTLPNLDLWLPSRQDIHSYLIQVQWLLDDVAQSVLHDNPLEARFREVFHTLVLASAWQETCWRQYVNRAGKRMPITSPMGAVGIMQVSPRVWRGFYERHPLSWSIEYNATAGAEILHHYLVHYAIRKGEHERANGLEDLARATYAAYNGGPGHLTRYRQKSTSPRLRRIDEAFWRKYKTVRAGNALAVRQCFG